MVYTSSPSALLSAGSFLCGAIRRQVSAAPPVRRSLFGTALAVSYGVAWLSFNYFEQRFLRFKQNFDPVFSQAATATVDMSVRELDRNFVEPERGATGTRRVFTQGLDIPPPPRRVS